MVRGEEKQFEVTIDRLIEYTKNVKISLLYFIQRIETEGDNMDWPQVLDSFTSICGQINTLMRYTRENKFQFIENRAVLPLHLSPEPDEELVKLTEGRVHIVNHEMVPDYLRTKPDPRIEDFEADLQTIADHITADAATKQINVMTKLVDNIVNAIKTNSARADNEMSKQIISPSFNSADTNELLLAVSTGRGLGMAPLRGTPMDPAINQRMEPSRPAIQKQNVKAPELKTNIKAGP